jgi:hypothetical protein
VDRGKKRVQEEQGGARFKNMVRERVGQTLPTMSLPLVPQLPLNSAMVVRTLGVRSLKPDLA